MKVKHFIMALYLLALVFYPCDDGTSCGKLSTFDSTSTHQHYEAKDLCSPLCICACCAASAQLSTASITVPPVHPHSTRFITPYDDSPVANNAHAIWQPPKLA